MDHLQYVTLLAGSVHQRCRRRIALGSAGKATEIHRPRNGTHVPCWEKPAVAMAWLAWLWVPILDASGWGYLRTSQNISALQKTPTVLNWFFTSLYSVSDVWGIDWCFKELDWRRISGDHSTPKILQGADNGTLAGALGYAAWQLHDGVWWWFLMVPSGKLT